MPFDLICQSAVQRGRLKHSWLENQILNKSATKVLQLRRAGPWHALEYRFPSRVQEVTELANRVVEEYSPAQLVDKIALFAHLDDIMRSRIKNGVHAAYLAQSAVPARAKPLVEATHFLGRALEKVRTHWREGSADDIEVAWQNVLNAASRLRDELDELPKTIVLP